MYQQNQAWLNEWRAEQRQRRRNERIERLFQLCLGPTAVVVVVLVAVALFAVHG